MANSTIARLLAASCLTVVASQGLTTPLHAAEASSGVADDPAEIIVTANKREESARTVPMSLTIASGDKLLSAGVRSPEDLVKIVPGLTVQPSPFNTPVYTMRGIGFYETSLSAAPTVAVYVDEVPLPFSATTKLAVLDLQRVEVLKGPQGTLFGQNTTGGAINYIAAQPTSTLAAGADLTLSRFSTYDAQGFVSGPLSDKVSARVAARVVQGGAWQKSITRNDDLGKVKQLQGRAIVTWDAGPDFTVRAMVSAWQDRGDTQAPQLLVDSCGASTAGTCGNPEAAAFRAYPRPPHDNRSADWGAGVYGRANKRDDSFVQGSLRLEKGLTDNLKLISITSYSRYKTDSVQDFDGTTLNSADNNTTGYIHAFSQELRLNADFDKVRITSGLNYDRFNVYDRIFYNIGQSVSADPLYFVPGHLLPEYTYSFTHQISKTYAAFLNGEVQLSDRVKVTAGARYTNVKRSFSGCSFVLGVTADWFNQIFGTSLVDGQCSVFTPNFPQTYDPLLFDKLNEDNLSWNAVVDYKLSDKAMVYGRIAKGYKAGSFPTASVVSYTGLLPVHQESVLTYELGLKASLPDRLGELTIAGFYNDYKNKQLRSRKPDPLFGTLDGLVQIPSSWSKGIEASLTLRPVEGLTLSAGGTYLETRVTKYDGFDAFGTPTNFKGQRFPYAPKWSLVGDAEYRFPLGTGHEGYAGVSAVYNSATSSVLSNRDTAFTAADTRQVIKAYTLIDVRAGVSFGENKVKVGAFVRNLTNKYYWTNVLDSLSSIVRFTGMPRTYGLQASWRY
jgi:outer membrane receptor protein involved in Fe transport